ncbi:LacI family transcriptional regulator [Staphylococcus equorum]|uniref:LacI family transcriptional regulator n=1 Tax=Staphylococcus equorum TaxID=246432 RepID=A0A9X4L7V9_9STAP|nr:LacI family DNA-binding transcriptional regulator [Staphylococcus equorum]MDG0841854.1 LacI family transcriptional regulator [Staphylococcus equorum]MDG0858094.1 LacI family transcriptional regulator [Staphylococcus equorum]
MKKKNVSAEMVAKKANVSQSTVSRVFTPGKSVSEETKQKVLKVANELNYKPNALARGLITNKSKLIGLAMKDKQNPFYHEVLALFTQKLKQFGYSVLFVYTENEEIQQEEINQFIEYNVEAIIITDAVLSSDLVKKLKSSSIPVILFNRYDESLNCNSVSSDNIYAARSVAEYFYKQGYKHNLYVSGIYNTSTNRDRLQGFKQYFSERNQDIDMVEGDFTFETAYKSTLKYLKDGNRPQGIFGANDITALGALEAVKKMNIEVPNEIEVIGFDDIRMASWPNHQLSTWSQPLNNMIEETIEILLKDNFDEIEQRKLKGKFKFRKTTKTI